MVFALFLAVPLTASRGFWDQFTSVKWYVLEALSVAWFLVELWRCGSGGWPAFVRQRWPAPVLLGLLVLASCLRGGLAWGGPALLDRASFVLLALASFWYFRRNHGRARPVGIATGAAASLVVVVGLAQALGWDPLPGFSAGDHRSSFFGNVNMTAQFLGFAVVVLMAGPPGTAMRRVPASLREALLVLSFVYLWILSCRSVFLALSAGVAVLRLTGRLSLRSLARTLGVATLAILLLLQYGPVLGPRGGPRGAGTPGLGLRPATDKVTSTAMRLALWKGTLDLIRDHPLGVGSGSFGEAFIPYQLGLEEIATEALLFRTPHNEYLRTLAEEGVVFTAVAAGLLLSLLGRLVAAARAAPARSHPGSFLAAGGAFFAVEAFSQFPFGTAFGCLMAALLLGLALARIETGAPGAGAVSRGARVSWRLSGTLVAAVVLVLLGRTVASEWLFVNRTREIGAQEAACRLDPRNLPACVTAAWLQAAAGHRGEARARLVRVLRNAPYYHPAIRLLGEVAGADGDRRAACLYLRIYDDLFRGRSALHWRLEASCGGAPPDGFPGGVRMPYYGAMPLAKVDAADR